LEDLTLARHASQPVFIGQLHAFAAAIVNIGKADHMRSDFTGRIEATELFLRVDARNLQVQHPLPLLGGQAAHQVDEFTPGLFFEALLQHTGILAERSRKLIPATLGILQFAWIAPQRGHRRTDGQRLAMSVGNQPAMGGNRDMPHAAGVALAFEKGLIAHLQIDDTPGDNPYHKREQTQDDTKTPWVKRPLKLHWDTSLTSAASGTCIFSCSLASVSIRLWAVQVLCSRISRPHSACALSRTLSSAYRSLSSCRFQCAL